MRVVSVMGQLMDYSTITLSAYVAWSNIFTRRNSAVASDALVFNHRGQTEAISPIRIQTQLGTPPNTGRSGIAYPNMTGEEIV